MSGEDSSPKLVCIEQEQNPRVFTSNPCQQELTPWLTMYQYRLRRRHVPDP